MRAARRRSTACCCSRAAKGLAPELLDLRNSGDTAGDKSRVVGYASIAFSDGGTPSRVEPDTADKGEVLLPLARATIARQLGLQLTAREDAAFLRETGASFVTLKRDGQLRGCIGSLEARRPLLDDVKHNARAAAFLDPRFRPLSLREFDEIRVEVSLLSAATPIEFRDEADLLAQLRPDVDGLILEHGQHGGTFLPQVWESLPDACRVLHASQEQGRAAHGFLVRGYPRLALHGREMERSMTHEQPTPHAGGTRSTTAASSATSAPATANCTKASAARASCASVSATQMVLTTYGRSSGFCVDPIEKKPLNHFYPGSAVFSFGTAGCNLACKFCQNWDISKSRDMDRLMDQASPEQIADAALQTGSKSVAFTYNDPVIFAEYAMDVADACHERDLKTVAVTAGYMHDAPRREFYAKMDAANVDLKGFTDEFYVKLTGSHLQPVLDTLKYLVHETDVWVEITTLLIPDEERFRRRTAARCPPGSHANWGRTCRCTSRRSIPTSR